MSFFQQQYRNFDLFESLYGIQKLLFTFFKILITYQEGGDVRAPLRQQLLIGMNETHWVQSFWWEMTKQLLHVELIGGVRPLIYQRTPINITPRRNDLTICTRKWQQLETRSTTKNYSCEPGSAQDFFLVKGNCFCHSCLFLQGT